MINMEIVQGRILYRMSEDESFKNLSLKDSMRLVQMFQETLVHVELEDHRRREQEKYGWDMLLFEEEVDPDPDAAEKAREAELTKEREERDRMVEDQRKMAREAEKFYAEQAKLGPIDSTTPRTDPLKIYRMKKEDPENHKFWE